MELYENVAKLEMQSKCLMKCLKEISLFYFLEMHRKLLYFMLGTYVLCYLDHDSFRKLIYIYTNFKLHDEQFFVVIG